MNNILGLTLKSLNKIYNTVSPTDNYGYTDRLVRISDSESIELITNTLQAEAPAMICRFGNVELNCLLHYRAMKQEIPVVRKSIRYIKGDTFPFWWDDGIINYMTNNAGFINATTKNLDRFCERMINDMPLVDILGSWMEGEKQFDDYMPNATKVKIRLLAPWNYATPWSKVLENKKVLIVHPYEKSIQRQFPKRAKLFPDENILPPFELQTVKAVQSIAQNKTRFHDWFDALHFMENEISKKDFDIAILGCGAYGFPLAAHIKRLGKKSVNMGGVTQLLFGIKGKRWENHYPENSFFNEYWCNPLPEEVPQNFRKIEGGCYW